MTKEVLSAKKFKELKDLPQGIDAQHLISNPSYEQEEFATRANRRLC